MSGNSESTSGGGSLLAAVRGRYVARLSAALLGAVVLLVVVGFAVQAQTAAQVREDARGDLRTAAEVQSSEVDTWLAANERQARTVSELPVFATDDPAEIRPRLRRLLASGQVADDVVAIHYVDTAEGRIVTSTKDRFVGVRPAEQGAPFVSKFEAGFSGPEEVYVSRPFRIELVDFPVVAVISPTPATEDRAIILMINPTRETRALTQFTEGGHTHVVTADGDAVAAPGNQTHAGPARRTAIERARAGDSGVVVLEDGSLLGYAPVESAGWVVLTHVPRGTAYALTGTVRAGLGAMALLALVSIGLVGVTVGRSTAIALRSLAADARELGEGSLDVAFDVDRADEIGTLATALAEMRDSLRATIGDAEEARERADRNRRETEALNEHLEAKATEYGDALAAVADGDLTRRVDPESPSPAMEAVGEAINQAVAALEATVAEVTAFAAEVAAASRQVDAGATEVRRAGEEASEAVQGISRGATRQSEMLEEVAGEMQTLSATAEEVASAADDLAATSERAAAAGQQGREAARAAIREMHEVEDRTEGAVERMAALDGEMDAIGEVAELIAEVAEQTNVLALNASIEASRAGEAGEGFAVVAEEVKDLAEETREAAADVEARIERLRERTGATAEDIQETRRRLAAGVQTVEEAVDALEAIADHVEATDAGVKEISEATAEQARSAQSVASTVDDLAAISRETTGEAETVAAAAEEQAATLTEVSENAGHLADRAGELGDLLDAFEARERADRDRPDAVPAADD